MDRLDDLLHRLSRDEKPSPTFRATAKERLLRRIEARGVRTLARGVSPTSAFRTSVKERLLQRIALPDTVRILPTLKQAFSLNAADTRALKHRILLRLLPLKPVPVYDRALKWTAAACAFVLLVRVLPFAFLAPSLQAEGSVDIVPTRGAVTLTLGGISMPLEEAQTLRGPALLQTADGEATVTFHDDAVVRLAPETTIRIHDLTDRPNPTSGPTISVVRGTAWIVGFLPPTVTPFIAEVPGSAQVLVHEGSVSIDAADTSTVSVYDRRASVERAKDEQFLVAGDRLRVAVSGPLTVHTFPQDLFASDWASANLERDAVHRGEIAERQRERRSEMAGILPTSILYPAKRIAEEMDVLLTVGSDARAQKRIQYADTRFNEALALLSEGEGDEANVQLEAYRESLLTLASGTGDNLVKFLIQKQVADASTAVAALTPDDEKYAIKEAVYDVVASVPDAPLKAQDIEGYVLVDKLAAVNHLLAQSGSTAEAAAALKEVQPYLDDILGDASAVHPALQKEARSLLITAASTLEHMPESDEITALEAELSTYLPEQEQDVELVRTTEAELTTIVQDIVDRIFFYKMPRSRYNQLYLEMRKLDNNPDRGAILRRLYHALPENGLAIYVRNEMKDLKGELHP